MTHDTCRECASTLIGDEKHLCADCVEAMFHPDDDDPALDSKDAERVLAWLHDLNDSTEELIEAVHNHRATVRDFMNDLALSYRKHVKENATK